jgi:hypothetical protein
VETERYSAREVSLITFSAALFMAAELKYSKTIVKTHPILLLFTGSMDIIIFKVMFG